MGLLRRRLASGALALTVLQFTLLFAAPVSCCMPGAFRLKAEATGVQTGEVDCCPPGSHAPGQCPRHKSKERGSTVQDRGSNCRMMCDAPHGPQFLLGTIGIVSAPQSTPINLTTNALPAGAPFTATARPSLPNAPPPRLL